MRRNIQLTPPTLNAFEGLVMLAQYDISRLRLKSLAKGLLLVFPRRKLLLASRSSSGRQQTIMGGSVAPITCTRQKRFVECIEMYSPTRRKQMDKSNKRTS